jgi:hypothetical protein
MSIGHSKCGSENYLEIAMEVAYTRLARYAC